MTTITETVSAIDGSEDNQRWVFFTGSIRESSSGGIISTKKVFKNPVAGVLTVELDPGPAVVVSGAADGKSYPFTVPDTDSELWPLIQAAVTIPPSTRHQELVDAVAAWLEDNPDVATISDVTAAVNALVAGAPGALDTLNELAAALGDDANFAATVTAALASRQNTATNLLLDGQYKRDATWWAGELVTGKTLSTTQAFNGTTSLKIVGSHSHHPNVTAAGQTGDDATYAVITSEGGRVYRYSCRIFRPSANTSSGYFRSWIGCVGSGGDDLNGGYGPEDVLNQTDMPTNTWFEYTNWFFVPYTGTHAPYSGVYPQIATQSVNATDVFYVDNERFEDMTNSPPQLVAAPPTGDRTTDTKNVQRLVNLAQNFRGTVILREGTYAVDIVTARTYRQPRIVGQGKQLTFIDGTIKMCGQQTTSDDNFTGGWLQGFSWTGSHAGQAALELNGVTGVHGKELYVRGTYANGILFHNDLTDAYTETCSFVMDISDDVVEAVRYKLTNGQASFHGCGLELGSNIQCNTTNAAVYIATNARPYNAPMSARFWTATDAVPIFQHNGEVQSNFTGNMCVEAIGSGVPPQGTGMWIAAGNPVYLGGSLNTYLGAGALNYGTFRVMGNVEAQGGSLTPGVSAGPTVTGHLLVSTDSGENAPLDLQTNGSNRWTIQKNDTPESGTDIGSDLEVVGYNNSGASPFLAMSINRDTGIADFQYGLTLGTALTAAGSAVTTDGTQPLTHKDLTGTGNTFPELIAPGTHAATGKTTPVDADEVPIVDSAASNVLKKLTFANLKAWFKSYYDSVTTTMSNKTFTAPKIDSGSGVVARLDLQTDGVNRWTIQKNATAESGSDVGADFEIVGFNNSGSGNFSAMKIDRHAGSANFPYGITSRVNTINAPGATPALAWDSYDQINLTGINAAITSLSSGITGTPTAGQRGVLRFKDDGTGRAITAGTSWRAIGVTLSTTTVANKTLYWFWVYNSTDSKYDVYDVKIEA